MNAGAFQVLTKIVLLNSDLGIDANLANELVFANVLKELKLSCSSQSLIGDLKL